MIYFGIHKTTEGTNLPVTNKLPVLLDSGAVVVGENELEHKPDLICLVHGFTYEICMYVYSLDFISYIKETDFRQKTWLIYKGAKELSKY